MASSRIGQQLQPQREVRWHVIRPTAQHVALVEQRRHSGRFRRVCVDHHSRQPRMQRQRRRPPARLCHSTRVIEQTERHQQRPTLRHRTPRRRVQPVEAGTITGAPHPQFQRQAAQVHLRDLRLEVLAPCALLHLRPQPVRHARPLPARTPRPLVRRRAARRHGPQSRHPRAHVEPRHPGEPGVHHDPNAFNRQ